jgi:hypothetical protein
VTADDRSRNVPARNLAAPAGVRCLAELKVNGGRSPTVKRSLYFVAIAVGCVFAFTASVHSTAWADQAYHTERLPFEAVNGDPVLRSGHVINAHSNGPIRYAREDYMVNGAAPNETYDVVIQVFFGESCEGDPNLALPTAQILTNANGQGHASHVFVPDDVAPFNPPLTVHARWVLERGGATQYETQCTVINLD